MAVGMKGYSLTVVYTALTGRVFPYAMWPPLIVVPLSSLRLFPRALSLSAVQVMPKERKRKVLL